MKPIKVLANASDILDVLSADGPLSPAAIAERLDIPRPSVYRLLDGLHSIGLTEPLPDATSRLSLRWLHLADAARASMPEWKGARELLTDLVARTGQTAYLCVRRNSEAVCIDWEQGKGIGILMLKPGRSLPLYAGAAGRTVLAFDTDIDAYLSDSSRRAFTPKTLTHEDELRADVEHTTTDGFATSIDDVTEGISALGVPVWAANGRFKGALSLAGLTADITDRHTELVRVLRESAAQLVNSSPRH